MLENSLPEQSLFQSFWLCFLLKRSHTTWVLWARCIACAWNTEHWIINLISWVSVHDEIQSISTLINSSWYSCIILSCIVIFSWKSPSVKSWSTQSSFTWVLEILEPIFWGNNTSISCGATFAAPWFLWQNDVQRVVNVDDTAFDSKFLGEGNTNCFESAAWEVGSLSVVLDVVPEFSGFVDFGFAIALYELLGEGFRPYWSGGRLEGENGEWEAGENDEVFHLRYEINIKCSFKVLSVD